MLSEMEYNTQRNKMIIPEYGRNMQKMIDQCCQIEDREKRTRTAEFIVNVMAQMNPRAKEAVDYKQKLWDHLYLISDFRLDVDSPFPPPARDILKHKPKRLHYPNLDIRFAHYGKNIERIIEKAAEYPEGPEKEALVKAIANHLKKAYLNWNRNSVDDDVILKHLAILSHNRLKLDDDFRFHQTSEILARNKTKKKFIKPGSSQGSNMHRNFKRKQG
jgi:hypothetical protein